MTDAEHWAHLQKLAKELGEQFPDAVFIGGLAVFAHAKRLGSRWQEGSHDVDLYLSVTGKSEMRDAYAMHRSPHLHKDSVTIEGEDFDVYTEHQHRLAVPYELVATHSLMIDGLRVAALEHLFVLKADAAINRAGNPKGEKDLRDMVRILLLLGNPKEELLTPYLTLKRQGIVQQIADRGDLLLKMGLNQHEASKYRQELGKTVKTLLAGDGNGAGLA